LSPSTVKDQPTALSKLGEKRKQLWEKIGLILVSGLLYALAIASVGVASRYIAPVPLTVLRLLTASLIFCGILLYSKPRFLWRPRMVLDLAIVGVFNIGLPFLLLAMSMRYISSSLASILFNVAPPMTVVLAHFMLRDEKLRPATVIGAAIAVGGAVVLLTNNASGLSVSHGQGWIGQILIILAAAGGAFAVVYTRIRLRQENTTVLAAGQVFACLAVFGALSLLTGDLPRVSAYPWQAWAAVIASAVTAPVIGFWLLFYMVNKFSATLGGFASIATPLFSAVIGILFLGEVMTMPIVLGTILLLAGIWSLNSF
jgi:drug/metabolite transporter (DMT)-like permease